MLPLGMRDADLRADDFYHHGARDSLGPPLKLQTKALIIRGIAPVGRPVELPFDCVNNVTRKRHAPARSQKSAFTALILQLHPHSFLASPVLLVRSAGSGLETPSIRRKPAIGAVSSRHQTITNTSDGPSWER